MLTLVIESCTERSLVSLVEEGICLYAAGMPFGLHNSKYLLPKIEEGFHLLSKGPKDLKLIVCGIGPGSYTGIRVGASIAKAMSYSLKVPLAGVSSLQGFLPDKEAAFAAIFDAKMGGAYFMKGIKDNSGIRYLTGPQNSPLEELIDRLRGVEVLVGPSIEHLKGKLEGLGGDPAWTWQESAPDPVHLAHLGMERLRKNEATLDGALPLLYMREP